MPKHSDLSGADLHTPKAHTFDSHSDVPAITEAQGQIAYYNGSNWIALEPGTNGFFLKTQGAAANPVWSAAGVGSHTLDGSEHSDVTAITEAQGQVLYYDGSNWNALDPGTSGKFLKTQGAAANPIWDDVPVAAHTFDGSEHSDVTAITEAQGQLLYWDGSNWNALAVGTAGQLLQTAGAAANPVWFSRVIAIQFVMGVKGTALTTGLKGFLQIPFACTINRVTMGADQSGSAVVDIWKDTYANFPPADADSITASAVPTISGAVKSEDSTLTGWTTAIAADDWLGYSVDSAATLELLTISLRATIP